MSRTDDRNQPQKRIQILYTKLTNHSISPSELEELYTLMSENEYSLNQNMWKTWKNSNYEPKEEHLIQHLNETKNKVANHSGRIKRLRIWGSVAATFLLLIVGALTLNQDRNTAYYVTEFGERETILLPDGSSVELNANSTLTWDNDWERTGVRKVRLTGEAFFDVAHLDQNQKFRVSTSDLNIEVLGTSFNVLKRDTNTEVYLREGKVKLGFQGHNSSKDTVIMAPGQKISYSKERDQIINNIENNPEKEASWKNGVLYFEDKSVNEILVEVSQVYGIEYSIPDAELAGKKMNFGVPYTDWETTKEAFELTMGLEMKKENGIYIVQKR